jgi:hypothetical protein
VAVLVLPAGRDSYSPQESSWSLGALAAHTGLKAPDFSPGDVYVRFLFFAFAQRASMTTRIRRDRSAAGTSAHFAVAAFFALSLRSSAVMLLARAFPPRDVKS